MPYSHLVPRMIIPPLFCNTLTAGVPGAILPPSQPPGRPGAGELAKFQGLFGSNFPPQEPHSEDPKERYGRAIGRTGQDKRGVAVFPRGRWRVISPAPAGLQSSPIIT